jgi:hypothetical protein
MSLKLYRQSGGRLEPTQGVSGDWRRRLRSRRWRSAPLENPEARVTSPVQAVLFFLGLALATFVIITVGYGTGFWR